MTTTATALADQVIVEPGLYPDTTNSAYHADPVAGGSLSSSEARALLPPSCPAQFRWTKDHGDSPKAHYDFGHAAHRLVLDAGADIEIVDAPDWRTKAAKAQRDEARENGRTPMLIGDYEPLDAMAEAIRRHDIARALLNPDTGRAEQTLVWDDQQSGVRCRARLDWLPEPTNGRLIVPDYKTCHSAEPDALSKAAHQFGYHQQADWYLDGIKALGLGGEDAAFLFICQEKTAPYIVTIAELDSEAMRIAASRNRRARDLYARCTATDHWPPYEEDIALVALPPWAGIKEGVHNR